MDLLETIRIVRADSKWISPDVAAQLASHMGEEGLSAREIEVLSLVAVGQSNKVIDAQLFITGSDRQGAREKYSGQARSKRSNPCGDAGSAPGNY